MRSSAEMRDSKKQFTIMRGGSAVQPFERILKIFMSMKPEVTALMKRYSRIQGLLLCMGTVAAAVIFFLGISVKSYWALAIPLAVGLLWLLGLGFWIGWTLLTIKVEPTKE